MLMRRKRKNTAEYYDHLHAKAIANAAQRQYSMVAIGHPKGMKYECHRGNGKPNQRRLLQQSFSYGRIIRYVRQECAERGLRAIPVLEAWTSIQCHRCGSMWSRRIGQSQFWCLDCGLKYNADWNAAINIGSVFFAERLGRVAVEDLANARDELAYKPISLEIGKKAPMR